MSGELAGVADEDLSRTGRDGAKEPIEENGIHHRHLIDDDLCPFASSLTFCGPPLELVYVCSGERFSVCHHIASS